MFVFFFSSRRRHTRFDCDWSSDVCSSDLVVDASVILAGLLGAIFWDLITWWGGLPTSSSHALMGGYGGGAVAEAGFSAILLAGWGEAVGFLVVAPVIGPTLPPLLFVPPSWVFGGGPAPPRGPAF